MKDKYTEIKVKDLFEQEDYKQISDRDQKWNKAYSDGWKFSTLKGVFKKGTEND